jgi:hypothetical protein
MSGAVVRAELAVSGSAELDRLVSVELVAAASLELPGLHAAVDGAGLAVQLGIDLTRSGALGPLTVGTAFRPPRGMGVELTLPGARGGGYLARTDEDLRGALVVDVGVLRVSGLGILGTRRSSFLVLLAAEFDPPLQLSFGFTLIGVGGLLGINRATSLDDLSRATASGDLGQLLFPRDPVAAAGHLLDVLDRCFPYADGGIIVGPMLKLGWGTPTLVSASIGVIVDTANERVVLVGRLLVTLPFEDLALIRIEALVLGSVDADGVAIDASLVNSTIAGATVEGDLRIRLRGGPNGAMALSAGGFHPAFPPPPGMAGMRRLAMSLSPGPILQIRLEAYLALTSTSVQFGAHLEIRAGVDGFGIHGHAGFDALVVFEPTFGFIASLEASVSIECADFDVASVALHAELAGTAPWRIRGHASISILFFDVDVDVPEISWGSAPVAAVPPRDPLTVLAEQLARPEAWSAASDPVPQLVQLRPDAATDAVAVHPLGRVGVRQNAVPLETVLTRMDGVRLPVPVVLRVLPPGGPGGGAVLRAPFVPSRFFELDAAAQLSSAGVVELPAGLELDAAAPEAPRGQEREWDYEQKVLLRTRRSRPFLRLADSITATAVPRLAAPVLQVPLVQVRDPRAVLAPVGALTDATVQVGIRLAGAGGTAGVLGEQLTAAAAAGLTTPLEATLARGALAGLGAGAVQVVAAWEVGS